MRWNTSALLVKFAHFLLMLPFVLRYARRNKPGRFTAAAIPQKLVRPAVI